jgi:hypothetical protein
MKAILFAVASMFVVTASVTPSLARPYYQDRAVMNFSYGFQYLSHRAYQGRSYRQTAYSAHHYRHSESYARGTQYYRQHVNYTRAARHYVSTRVTRAGSLSSKCKLHTQHGLGSLCHRRTARTLVRLVDAHPEGRRT